MKALLIWFHICIIFSIEAKASSHCFQEFLPTFLNQHHVSNHTLATRFSTLDEAEKIKFLDLLAQQNSELTKKIVTAIEHGQIHPDIVLAKIENLNSPTTADIEKIFNIELITKKQNQAVKWIDTPIPQKEITQFKNRWSEIKVSSEAINWNEFRKQKQFAEKVQKIEEQRLPFSGASLKFNQEEQLANANWRKANNAVNEWVKRGKDLELDKLKEINALIGKGLDLNGHEAGMIRNLDVKAGLDYYIPPTSIDANLNQFLRWYQTNEKTMEPIQLAAESYQKLLSIHPFGDANKRTSRLIMDWILQKNGLPPALMKSEESFLSLFPTSAMTDKVKALENTTKSIERSFEVLIFPKLMTNAEYEALVLKQAKEGVIDLTTVPRPGLASIRNGKISIKQGAGRWENASENDFLDLFVPQNSVLPAGAIVKEENISAELVRNANLLSSRGVNGTNPDFLDLKMNNMESSFKRIFVPKKMTTPSHSVVYAETATVMEALKKEFSTEKIQNLISTESFKKMNSHEQLKYLQSLIKK